MSLTNKPVIIIGAGGHAKVLVNALKLSGRKIIGLTDNQKIGTVLGIPILGEDEIINHYNFQEIELVNGIGMLPKSDTRQRVFLKSKEKGYVFAIVIHPSAVISEDVGLQEGVQIMAGAVLQPSVTIGENTIINTSASIDHDCHIGAHCHIAPGVTLSGGVKIDDGSFVGVGSAIIQGIHLQKNAMIPAGMIVRKNVMSPIESHEFLEEY